MKRIISILLCVVLAISLVACNNDATGDASSSKASSNSKPASSTTASSEEVSSSVGSSEAQTSSSDVPSVIPTVNNYQKTTYNFVEITDYFHITGRTAVGTSTEATGSKAGMVYDHAAQGLLFKADCEGDITLSLALSMRDKDNTHYYTVYIDGVKQDRVSVKGTSGAEALVELKVASGLKRGVHNIEVYRNHESIIGISTLLSVTMNGVPQKWVNDTNKLRIEFIGDSITSGSGLYGQNGAADQGDVKYSDATASYAFLTARALNAEASIVGRSGMMFTAKENNPALMYKHYNTLSYARDKNLAYDNTKMDVDLYVIALGANDAKGYYKDEDLTAKAKTALETVRKDHPNAKILWVYGQLHNDGKAAVEAAVEQMGGAEKGFYFYCCTIPDMSGSSAHPNAEAQKRDADEIVNFIKNTIKLK